MKDLRVVVAKNLLRVTAVAPVRDFAPAAILILGEKLNTADEIQYNGIEVDEFIIAAPNRIIAKIPESQIGLRLTDLRVFSPVPLSKNDAIVSLIIARPVRMVEGIDRLVQEWVLTFLSSPGSDIFNPISGGGARAIIGQPVYDGGKSATAQLSIAVDKTRQQLLSSQAKNPRIPPAERLLSSSLSNVNFDSHTTALTAVVNIKNVLGSTASVTVR